MSLIPVNLVYEDLISEFVMTKLVESTGKYRIGNTYSEGGFGYIKKNLSGFNNAAKGCPFFVLTDLDTVDCAPSLIKSWLKVPVQPNLIFRVAVREIESWLLADIEGFSAYTGISVANFPKNPEELIDPKLELLNLIRKCRKRDIREDILPRDEFAAIGPNYNGRLAEYVCSFWNIERASKRSRSLLKAIQHLNRFHLAHNV